MDASRRRPFFDSNSPLMPLVVIDFDLLILVQIGLALALTYCAIEFDYRTDPTMLTMLSSLLLFPLAFSINQAHNRRQDVLKNLASLKATMWSIHAFHVRWAKRIDEADGRVPNGRFVADDAEELNMSHEKGVDQLVSNILTLFKDIYLFLVKNRDGPRTHRGKRSNELEAVYAGFRAIDTENNALFKACHANAAAIGPVIPVTVENNLNSAIEAFELVKAARDYPTPRVTREYFKVFGFIFPLVLTPAYAEMSHTGQPWNGYLSAVFVTLMFGMLINAQDMLDNCFNKVTDENAPPGKKLRRHPDKVNLTSLILFPQLTMRSSFGSGLNQDDALGCTLRGGPTTKFLPALVRALRVGTQDGSELPPPDSAGVERKRSNSDSSLKDEARVPGLIALAAMFDLGAESAARVEVGKGVGSAHALPLAVAEQLVEVVPAGGDVKRSASAALADGHNHSVPNPTSTSEEAPDHHAGPADVFQPSTPPHRRGRFYVASNVDAGVNSDEAPEANAPAAPDEAADPGIHHAASASAPPTAAAGSENGEAANTRSLFL